MSEERRRFGLRRDLNDLVRDRDGFISTSKVGTLIAQWLSVKLILEHGSEIIANWDSLLVLFTVLLAPEIIKRVVENKYGVVTGSTTTTTDTSTQTSTTKALQGVTG